MMTQVRWLAQGWTGGPGYIPFRVRGQLSSSAVDTWMTRLRTFIASLTTYTPSGISYSCEQSVTFVDETDGSIKGVAGIATPPAAVAGVGSGSWSSVSGLAVIWRTGVTNQRRLTQGRTFFVPLAGTAYTSGGFLAPAMITAVGNAALAYVATPPLQTDGRAVVWHRPSTKGATDGRMVDIASANIGNSPAELKSRRP